MNFIHPNEILAQEMVQAMSSHIEDETMLPVSLHEIMSDLESWFASIGLNDKLSGFFCIRRPHENFAEIGSVKSLQGTLPKMVQKFETQRKIEGQAYGCAITRNAPQKFAQLTQGKIMRTFPPWYDRVQSDKHFVQWQ